MTKKKEVAPKLLTVVPKGDPNNFCVMYADSFDRVFDNGTTGLNGSFVPDAEMIERIQLNIITALAKMDIYKEELLQAQNLLSKIVPHESYAKLEEEIKIKRLKM